ncbi:hypothetical protein KJ682_08860 [bacterium]|nr:hypothetical protein [bacterium]
MITVRTGDNLMWGDPVLRPPAPDHSGVLAELRLLGRGQMDHSTLAGELYDLLRKHSGEPLVPSVLLGIQNLAVHGDPAGARLLAALLDVVTPASRLLPLVRRMSSTRRLWINGSWNPGPSSLVLREWRDRHVRFAAECDRLLAGGRRPDEVRLDAAGWESPWGSMRLVLDRLCRAGESRGELPAELGGVLAGLLRLEADAWQERISQLAGNVDPFRMEAIARVLPLLSRSDREIRDIRELVAMIESGDVADAFLKPRLRGRSVMDAREFGMFERALEGCPDLSPLHSLVRAQVESALEIPVMAHAAARLMGLAERLKLRGDRLQGLDLVTACRLVVSCCERGELAIPVPEALTGAVQEILGEPVPAGVSGPAGWDLRGMEFLVGHLVIVLPDPDDLPEVWPHGLPTLEGPAGIAVDCGAEDQAAEQEAGESPDGEGGEAEPTAAAMKNLVLTNIQSYSLVLGFLRNPKFTCVPGLVEAVAVRTRNPQVIETIATDRALHTGFANRGVPLACLRSPVNVSVKILRRFIKVKYVSKVDLRRLAQDRAGVRKEVIREIEKYLETLA